MKKHIMILTAAMAIAAFTAAMGQDSPAAAKARTYDCKVEKW